MEKNVAVVAVIVSDVDAVEKVNTLLTENREHIIGRMGIPHVNGYNIISVVLNATQETINGLSGKLGMISGVKSKVLIAK